MKNSKYFSILLASFLVLQPGSLALADYSSLEYPSYTTSSYSYPTYSSLEYPSYPTYSSLEYPSYAPTYTYTPSTPTYTIYDYFHTPTPTYTTYYYCTYPCSGYYRYDGYYYWCSQPCSYYFYPSYTPTYTMSNYFSTPSAPTTYPSYPAYTMSNYFNAPSAPTTYPYPYSSLTVSCSASPNPGQTNQAVTFTAYPSSGSGSYSYDWYGDCSGTASACSQTFSSARTYTAWVTVASGSQSAPASCSVTIQTPSLSINKLVRNITDGTGFQDSVSADPLDRLEFSIQATSTSSTATYYNVRVQDILPSGINYIGPIKVDNLYPGGDIASWVNIGSLSPNQSKTLTFEAKVASATAFFPGTTNLTNYGRVSADSVSQIEDTAIVSVIRP